MRSHNVPSYDVTGKGARNCSKKCYVTCVILENLWNGFMKGKNHVIKWLISVKFFRVICLFPQFNFIAVSCGVNATQASDRKALIHDITANGWREDRVIWHCTSQCASSIYEATNQIRKNTAAGQFTMVIFWYCGWLNFRWVPIFMVFVEGPNHEFQCQRISDFLNELWRKILWPQILNHMNVSILFNPQK